MNLYEVIYWGQRNAPDEADTLYLVRAADWRAAVDSVRNHVSTLHHPSIPPSLLANRVHEMGKDLSSSALPEPEILRGPFFQSAYNRGWRAWNRITGDDEADEWREEAG